MSEKKSPFVDELEECIVFIKRHKLSAEQIATKFTMKEVGKICEYLGVGYIEGEREAEQAERLHKDIFK